MSEQDKACPFCGCTTINDDSNSLLKWKVCDWCGAEGPAEKPDSDPPQGWNRRADLAQAPAPVRVNPLVWDDFGGLGAKASAYYQANYLIQFWKSQGQFEVALSFPGYQTGYDGERWHPTLKAAKAAAQADYEARILAALEPDAGVVAELVEAHRENARVLSHMHNDLQGRVDATKLAALFECLARSTAALALIAHNTTEG